MFIYLYILSVSDFTKAEQFQALSIWFIKNVYMSQQYSSESMLSKITYCKTSIDCFKTESFKNNYQSFTYTVKKPLSSARASNSLVKFEHRL